VAKKKSTTHTFPRIAEESNGWPLRSVRVNAGSSNIFLSGVAESPGDGEGLLSHPHSAAKTANNIERPTPNIQRRMSAAFSRLRHWKLDVGRWTFDVRRRAFDVFITLW
jgi:hypothetical protein